MSTLGSQPARCQHRVDSQSLADFLQDATELAKKYGIGIEAVIQARLALELSRKNNISAQNGDHTDEHVDGIGRILTRIATALEARV